MSEIATLNDYQKLAARTSGADGKTFTPNVFDLLPEPPSGPVRVRMETCGLGLVGEAGEFADYLKKVVGHGHPRDSAKELKELGDQFWYAAEFFSMIGLPLSEKSVDVVDRDTREMIESAKKMRAEDQKQSTRDLDLPLGLLASQARLVCGYASVVSINVGKLLNIWPLCPPRMLEQARVYVESLCALTHLAGFTVRQVLEANIAKLKLRYPGGFTSEASQNRPTE